jgi:hypothetical protein
MRRIKTKAMIVFNHNHLHPVKMIHFPFVPRPAYYNVALVTLPANEY